MTRPIDTPTLAAVTLKLPRILLLAATACGESEMLPTSMAEPEWCNPLSEPEDVRCGRYGDERPGRLSEHAAGYAPERDELIVFGGTRAIPEMCEFPAPDYQATTWVYEDSCNAWRRVAAPGPSARARHMAAYGEGLLWVFGGRFRRTGTSGGPFTLYDELWTFEPSTDTWEMVDARGSVPRARTDGALVWDGRRRQLWLFGGNASADPLAYQPLSDVWRFSPGEREWTEVVTQGDAPSPRLQHAMLYDPERDWLVVYGGSDESAFGAGAQYSRQTWALNLETLTWSVLDDGEDEGPGGRFWVSAIYDGEDDGYLLYGGHDDTSLGNRNDLWSFDPESSAWTRLSSGDTFNKETTEFCAPPYDFATVDVRAPERRSSHTLIRSTCHRALLFGGKTDCGSIDDVWVLDGSEWTNRLPASEGEVCWRAEGDPAACLGLCR